MDVIRFGIIGCGRISKRHAEAIALCQMTELATVCDIVPNKMDAAIDTYMRAANGAQRNVAQPSLIDDYHQLLKREDINAVVICTESGYHAAIALDALNAGKHVLVEKPLALSTSDADAMIKLAEEKGLKLGVCHQNRFNPPVQQLRQALEQGRFGKLIYGVASIRWNRDENYYAQAPWRGTWEHDGGTLMNQCIHNIDLLQWMLGDVDHVYAQTDRYLRQIQAEDTGLAVIRFNNGAMGIVEGTSCVYPKNLEETLSVFGATGTACLGGLAVNTIETWHFADMAQDEINLVRMASGDVDSVYGRGHEPLYHNFALAVQGIERLHIDGKEGKRAMEIVLAIYKSSRTGQPVRLPLGSYSTMTGLDGEE